MIYNDKLFDYYNSLVGIFWEVSNYNLWPMEKKNFNILLILVFLTSFCDSNYYNYDDYEYDQYNYDEYNYDEYNYDENYNYYENQNLPAPLPISPPPSPPPPPTPPPPTLPPQTGNYISIC